MFMGFIENRKYSICLKIVNNKPRVMIHCIHTEENVLETRRISMLGKHEKTRPSSPTGIFLFP